MSGSPRKAILGFGAFTLYLTVAYGAFKIQRVRNLPNPPAEIADPMFQRTFSKDKDCYTDIAKNYDKEIGIDEWIMGLLSRRYELVKGIQGKVLEVSSGTGRNLEYYPSDLQELILTDRNLSMLKSAQLKYKRDFKRKFSQILFATQDVENLQFPDNTFDHVVDTFGLCSCNDPVHALKEMARVTKPNGTIRLLEHGRSKYSLLNEFLDKTALERSMKWGCWWNRDISELVKAAGLKIREHKLYHFGTTSMIIAEKIEHPP